ncbi:hypothetical protein CBR_g8870 [Chara braunii]|uniref:Uncharacterized protein n=1 Tax=Chara braunii TaxID=69332 RepID=A0A388KN22_CHABU|nr:hypothetical protein CBR_g8870 [Chara braunii]|eukprot:GBG71452.1 hypothetical protein CBR_g8870 [Chara braunii]
MGPVVHCLGLASEVPVRQVVTVVIVATSTAGAVIVVESVDDDDASVVSVIFVVVVVVVIVTVVFAAADAANDDVAVVIAVGAESFIVFAAADIVVIVVITAVVSAAAAAANDDVIVVIAVDAVTFIVFTAAGIADVDVVVVIDVGTVTFVAACAVSMSFSTSSRSSNRSEPFAMFGYEEFESVVLCLVMGGKGGAMRPPARTPPPCGLCKREWHTPICAYDFCHVVCHGFSRVGGVATQRTEENWRSLELKLGSGDCAEAERRVSREGEITLHPTLRGEEGLSAL